MKWADNKLLKSSYGFTNNEVKERNLPNENLYINDFFQYYWVLI